MRTLIVNSMFANALYRTCADELGRIPDIDLTMLTVDAWRMNGRPMPFEELQTGSPYKTVIGAAGWKGKENRGFYRSGIARAFQLSKPEVLFIMEEPFSVFTTQLLVAKAVLAPHIPVVFFTWNNLSLTEFDYRPSIFYRNTSRFALKRMDYALTANKDGVKVLREFGFDRPAKVVGYGVDTQAYSAPRPERARELRGTLSISPGDLVIGYVGRLIEMKGVDLLIEAFAALQQNHPEQPMKLLLVGSGEAERDLLKLAQERGVSHLIRHVPSVEHADVPDYMHALEILVLPSRRVGMWAEQFGRVLVEAMAAGKIVIGSSSGAIPEVIGNAGFVFEENNTASLTFELNRAMMLTTSEKEVLAKLAGSRATRDYSWQRFASDAYEALAYCYAEKRRRGPLKREPRGPFQREPRP